MSKETIIGLRDTKASMQKCGGVSNVPSTFDMVKAAENSYQKYYKQTRQEKRKKDRNMLYNWNMKCIKGH